MTQKKQKRHNTEEKLTNHTLTNKRVENKRYKPQEEDNIKSHTADFSLGQYVRKSREYGKHLYLRVGLF